MRRCLPTGTGLQLGFATLSGSQVVLVPRPLRARCVTAHLCEAYSPTAPRPAVLESSVNARVGDAAQLVNRVLLVRNTAPSSVLRTMEDPQHHSDTGTKNGHHRFRRVNRQGRRLVPGV